MLWTSTCAIIYTGYKLQWYVHAVLGPAVFASDCTYVCVSLHAGEGVWGHPLYPLPGPPAQAHGAGAVP